MRFLTRLLTGVLLFCVTTGLAQNRVVGYYPAWVMAQLPAEDLNFDILTHVVHAFAWPDVEGNIQSYSDMLDVNTNIAVHEAGGYIQLSFGGWGNSDGFGPMTAKPETRQTFISNVIDICQYYEYDGVDFDWEHPTTTDETISYTTLIQELRAAVDTTFDNFLITMALPVSNWSGQHYNIAELEPHIDWFNAMTYDFHGSWTNHAGHNSPLYSSPPNDPDGSCHTGMNYLINTRGIDPQQINLGLAFYGKEFNASEINGASSGDVIAHRYSTIVNFIDQGWSYHWDEIAQTPYLQNLEQTKLITYDDVSSIKLKCEYANDRDLGGVMMWALGSDVIAGEQVLVNAIQPYALSIDEAFNHSGVINNFQLFQNYPNPFNPTTTISYELLEQATVKLTVFDIRGQEIMILEDASKPQGNYKMQWNGKDRLGNPGATGVYFARLETELFSEIVKMMYLK